MRGHTLRFIQYPFFIFSACFMMTNAMAAPSSTVNITASTGVSVISVVNSPPYKTPDGNIFCGNGCAHDYDSGDNVALFAEVGSGYEFSHWTGDCAAETTELCLLNNVVSGASYTSSAIAYPILSVAVQGAGTVTSNIGAINCTASGGICKDSYDGGFVLLSAASTPGYTPPNSFGGWVDCDFVSANGACRADMDSPKSITAVYTPHQTTVVIGALNGGTVESTNGAINCGGTCQASFDHDETAKFIVTPDAGYDFVSWGGACTGMETCKFTVDTISNPTRIDIFAVFSLQDRRLTVTKPAGAPLIRGLSPPYKIDCGADCQDDYLYGTTQTLHANTSDDDWRLNSWTGCDAHPSLNRCEVIMNNNKTVSANYIRRFQLSISASGKAGGNVTTTPASDIDITTTTNGSFNDEGYFDVDTAVTVNVTPRTHYQYEFGGDCTGTSCTINMTEARNVSVTFTPIIHTLTVSKSHAAAPSVFDAPFGSLIDCGLDCTEEMPEGDSLTLTASLNDPNNWAFSGWTGCDSVSASQNSVCAITINAPTNITANYTPRYALSVNHESLFHAGSDVTTTPASSIIVSSSAGGVSSDTAYFDEDSVVTVNVSPALAYAYSFSDDCTGTTCTVTMSETRNVDINYTLAQYNLAVTLAGAGSGSVTSDIGAIDCPGTCNDDYPYQFTGGFVNLTAVADAGSVISGWSNVSCENGSQLPDSCRVRVNEAQTAIVTFALSHDLTVTLTGGGLGSVVDSNFFVGSDDHINCGSNCMVTYTANTQVTLEAEAFQFHTFLGWSGAGCLGLNTCTVTMDNAKTVEARFEQLRAVNLTVQGSGRIHLDKPGTLDGLTQCEDSCSTSFPVDNAVEFEAVPSTGNVFIGWEGDCAFAGTNLTCTLNFSAAGARNVSAKFDIDGPKMQIDLQPGAQVSIVSNPSGIDCSGECTKNFLLNTTVLLTANTGSNIIVESWGFPQCPNSTSTCSVVMDGDKTATITLEADTDDDGVGNSIDNCTHTPNVTQSDANNDGEGDACDVNDDTDLDGLFDFEDNCPADANPLQEDDNGFEDGDDTGDACEVIADQGLCFPVKSSNNSIAVICL